MLYQFSKLTAFIYSMMLTAASGFFFKGNMSNGHLASIDLVPHNIGPSQNATPGPHDATEELFQF